jgi:hypothetical protein
MMPINRWAAAFPGAIESAFIQSRLGGSKLRGLIIRKEI